LVLYDLLKQESVPARWMLGILHPGLLSGNKKAVNTALSLSGTSGNGLCLGFRVMISFQLISDRPSRCTQWQGTAPQLHCLYLIRIS
jgi:hypothetical protein